MSERQVLVDAGGIELPDGRSIRTGHALRVSGGLTRDEELGQLEAAGIVQLVDLRGDDEDREVLESWAASHGVAYAHHPIRGGNVNAYLEQLMAIETVAEAEEFQLELYLEMIERHAASIASALDLIAGDGPVGFGCAAGKDRTGIVTAFMHVLLGLSEHEAVEHYLSLAPSVEALMPLVESTFDIEPGTPLPPGPQAMLSVREALLEEVFARVRETHGSLEGYLRDGGFPEDGAERLRARLLA